MNKGITNNPNGRPKGIPNKITSDTRELLSKFVSEKYGDIEDAWRQLDAFSKIAVWTKLVSLITPKPKGEDTAASTFVQRTPKEILQILSEFSPEERYNQVYGNIEDAETLNPEGEQRANKEKSGLSKG